MDTSTRVSGWRKSSRSANNGTCVELAWVGDAQAIRDSKAPGAGALALTPSQSADFFTSVKAGRFDRPRRGR
ncbi:DUF397 domain-containing protein [Actinoalloteichus hymeniacidonis]|uniref:DUF397 family protein n=1 Tax=Actinoalloteichus hymeniacidonis TaxID=340345 RepID=A0AAC9MYN8_9PSEU|nr:DUF397 domain-containing protein [Actinoalloteichus hymeniacidonis]AOS63182.1 putative DUF397 family protein [Actinoalloteichus hymeniacidonis]MBB5908781.1 hypothetical protein [Actinoalloteichus hymeniacidonis]